MFKRKTCQPSTWKNMFDVMYESHDKQRTEVVTTSTSIPLDICRIIMRYVGSIIDVNEWFLSIPEENLKEFVCCHPKKFLKPLSNYNIPIQRKGRIMNYSDLANAVKDCTGYSSGWRELAIRLLKNPDRVRAIAHHEAETRGKAIRKKNRATDIGRFLATVSKGEIVKTIDTESIYTSTQLHTHYIVLDVKKEKIITRAIHSGKERIFGVNVKRVGYTKQQCFADFQRTDVQFAIDYEVHYDQSGYWSGPGQGHFAAPEYTPKQDVNINGINMKNVTTCVSPRHWLKME